MYLLYLLCALGTEAAVWRREAGPGPPRPSAKGSEAREARAASLLEASTHAAAVRNAVVGLAKDMLGLGARGEAKALGPRAAEPLRVDVRGAGTAAANGVYVQTGVGQPVFAKGGDFTLQPCGSVWCLNRGGQPLYTSPRPLRGADPDLYTSNGTWYQSGTLPARGWAVHARDAGPPPSVCLGTDEHRVCVFGDEGGYEGETVVAGLMDAAKARMQRYASRLLSRAPRTADGGDRRFPQQQLKEEALRELPGSAKAQAMARDLDALPFAVGLEGGASRPGGPDAYLDLHDAVAKQTRLAEQPLCKNLVTLQKNLTRACMQTYTSVARDCKRDVDDMVLRGEEKVLLHAIGHVLDAVGAVVSVLHGGGGGAYLDAGLDKDANGQLRLADEAAIARHKKKTGSFTAEGPLDYLKDSMISVAWPVGAHWNPPLLQHMTEQKNTNWKTRTLSAMKGVPVYAWSFLWSAYTPPLWLAAIAAAPVGLTVPFLWAGFWAEGEARRGTKKALHRFAELAEGYLLHPHSKLGAMVDAANDLADCPWSQTEGFWRYASMLFANQMHMAPHVVMLMNKEIGDGERSLDKSIMWRTELPAIERTMYTHKSWKPTLWLIDLQGTCHTSFPLFRMRLMHGQWRRFVCVDCVSGECELGEELLVQLQALGFGEN